MEIRFKKRVLAATELVQQLSKHRHLKQCLAISQKKFFLKIELQVRMCSRSVLLPILVEAQNLANNLALKNNQLE